jgi:Cdc6-like AAA superfamily ATPase
MEYLIGGNVQAAPQNRAIVSIKQRHAVTPLFKGRQKILERLSEYFSKRSDGGHPQREFLLYGVGGCGKSQIALKFAENFGDR